MDSRVRVRTHNMRNDPLTREGDPREHQEEMGDGPVFWAQRRAGCPHPPLDSPKDTGCERVDDRKVLSGIIPVIQKGLRRVDAPAADGPPTKPSTTVAAAGETRVFLI